MERRFLESKSSLAAAAAALVVIAFSAVFLSRIQGMQRVGPPGVKVIERQVWDDSGAVAATNEVYLPEDLAGYVSSNLPITKVELDWLPKDTTYGRTAYLSTNGFLALMNVVLMGADRTSIHKPEYCLTGQGFRIDKTEFTTIRMQQPRPYELPVAKMTTTRSVKLADGREVEQRGLYVFWFVTHGELSANHNKRMLRIAQQLVVTGTLQRWAYVSCLAYCLPGQEDQTYAHMTELISAAVPRFQLYPDSSGDLAGAVSPSSVVNP